MRVKHESHPVVAISAVPRQVPTGYGADLADTTAASLAQAVVAAGGVPLVVPVVEPSVARLQVARVDALVLSGGQDLDDAPLQGPARPGEPWVDRRRDEHELALWSAARAQGLPVLGVCRGLQLVNVALGGDLVAHVDGHDAGDAYAERPHEVLLEAGTRLAAIVSAASVQVNTIHHQVVGALGAGLRCAGRSPDGLVEGAESTDGPWFVGVQWHPELMLSAPAGQPLFDALVRAAVTSSRAASVA